MARSYKYYYVRREEQVKLNGAKATAAASASAVSAPDPSTTVTGTLVSFYGFRFQSEFLDNGDLFRKLKFFMQDDINTENGRLPAPAPQMVFARTSVGARADYVRLFQFEISPLDKAVTSPIYGEGYVCRLACCSSLSDTALSTIMKEHRFSFTIGTETAEYRVTPGTVKEVRRKNNARVIN